MDLPKARLSHRVPRRNQAKQKTGDYRREQRKTESTIVNAFAYAGFIIAILSGLAVVLGIPYLRAHLLPATVVYTLWLLIGGRTLAAILGGYYGDRLAYDRARTRLRARWAEWLEERD